MIETEVRDKRSKSLLADTRNMSHFPFRGSPNNQNSSAPSSPPATAAAPPPPPASAMAVTSVGSPPAPTTVPPGARSASPQPPSSGGGGPQSGTNRCCDTGRIFTDPLTGQPVCTCQYEREAISNYQRLASIGGLAGPAGMPLSMYSSPYPEGMAAYFPALGADQAPFYPNPAAAGLDLKDNLTAGGAPWPPYPSVYHPYDAFAGYPFANGYGMDLNGARRKNATRETTSTLKAWLNEHKKNPYPTKGEKIMLAIITKMTLTQVSTWFANARRRLKKENKMTWEPRNRVEDDDVNLDDDDHKSNDEKDLLDSKDSGTGSSEDGDRPSRLDLLDRSHGPNDWSGSRNGSGPNSPDLVYHDPRGGPPPHPLLHPAHFPHHLRPPMGAPPDSNHNTTPNPNKPRIWSLADMASKDGGKDSDNPSPGSYPAGSSPGKMLSPLAARGLHPALHHPYMRPDLYRNFYGQAAAHLSDPHNVALLESYQRQLGAMAANGGLPPGLMKAGGPGGSFAPLSLTTNSQHHRASSPASSTSSSPRDRGDPPSDKPTALVTTASKP